MVLAFALLSACASPRMLREPTLPECFVEAERPEGRLTGKLDISPSLVESLMRFLGHPGPETAKVALLDMMQCLGESAKSLREALEEMRRANVGAR